MAESNVIDLAFSKKFGRAAYIEPPDPLAKHRASLVELRQAIDDLVDAAKAGTTPERLAELQAHVDMATQYVVFRAAEAAKAELAQQKRRAP